MEPVALQHAVVERGVGVLVVGERLVVRGEGRGAVGLDAARRDDRAIAGVGRLHLFAGRQRDGRERGVGGGERVVAVVGGVAELRRQRQQPLPRRVEHVRLLPVQILDRETVQRQRLGLLHPAVHHRQRQREQLGVEPRRRLAPQRQQVLDALAAAVGGVVALILVVVEGGEIVDAIGQLAEGVTILERGEERRGPRGQRAAPGGQRLDAGFERGAARLPVRRAGVDVVQLPRVGNVELITFLGRARGRRGGSGHLIVIHWRPSRVKGGLRHRLL